MKDGSPNRRPELQLVHDRPRTGGHGIAPGGVWARRPDSSVVRLRTHGERVATFSPQAPWRNGCIKARCKDWLVKAPRLTRSALTGSAVSMVLALCTLPLPVEARDTPTNATVLIRIRGTVRVSAGLWPGAPPEVTEFRDVEIGTGSGFVVSADGYIVTNHHAISDDTFEIERQGRKGRVSVHVQSIEVQFPSDTAVGSNRSQRYSATVVSSDETLDLAVLFVSGAGMPVAALGDSDAVVSGEPVRALGYPLGDLLDVARTGRDERAPAVTTSPGAVSALRLDDRGDVAYLQTTATLNPGNSGGPLVDQDGYVVGVVRMQVRGASGIGFAIPVNRVKRFLTSRGLDHQLPSRSLELGAVYAPRVKGLSVQLPYGFQDESPTRLHVEAPFAGITLRVDRVASPWRSDQIEQLLLAGQLFERSSWTRRAAGNTPKSGALRVVSARTTDGADEFAMEYVLTELRGERLIARYIGPADAVAFNRSTLRASLATLEGVPLVAENASLTRELTWANALNIDSSLRSLPLPVGWLVEPGETSSCGGLPPVEAGLTASPPGDFTITLRAGWLSESPLNAASVAARCSSRRTANGPTSYVAAANWLGTSYTIEGVFVERGQRLLHLQLVAPADKATAMSAMLAAWIKQLQP